VVLDTPAFVLSFPDARGIWVCFLFGSNRCKTVELDLNLYSNWNGMYCAMFYGLHGDASLPWAPLMQTW